MADTKRLDALAAIGALLAPKAKKLAAEVTQVALYAQKRKR